MGRGQLPEYGLPLAPTPHPLAELVGLVVSPLGPTASEHVVVALAYIALASLAFVVFRLGQAWFSAPVGLLGAALFITREPILSYGIRGYVDIPYVVLVLAALLVETRRRRAGASVLWLLALAGLLRPEAWLLGAGYWTYLAWSHTCQRAALVRLALIVVSAPMVWALSDLLVTGDPMWSLTHTQSTAVALNRVTGIQNVPVTGAHRLGEILRPDVLIAAAVGGALSRRLLRDRTRLGLLAGFGAGAAVALLASAGLPINTRYLMLVASLLAISAGAGVFGWLYLPLSHRRRRSWQVVGVLLAVVIVAYIPSQRTRVDRAFQALRRQEQIEADLRSLVGKGTIHRRCGPIGVTNHRAIPQLALLLRTRPGNIIDTQARPLTHGTYITLASPRIAREYMLDPSEAAQARSTEPRFLRVASLRDSSWRIYVLCP